MRWLMVLCAVLIGVLSVFAQEADSTTIELDVPVRVRIQADAPEMLVYSDSAPGTTLTLTAQAVTDTVDPVLWVVDPDDYLLAYADNSLTEDGEQQTVARIESFVVPASGEIMIYVDSFNGVSEGEVEVLIVESDPFNTRIEEDDDQTLITAYLPEDHVFRYVWNANAGDQFSITVRDTSGMLDPYLRIRDAEGQIVMSNDDHNTLDTTLNSFDAQIKDWEIPAGGQYQIEVIGFLGRAGAFQLEIQRSE